MLAGGRVRGVASEGAQQPAERIAIECRAVSARLQAVFEEPIRTALARRPGCYHVSIGPGREPDEILVVIRAAGRRLPLHLFFPQADLLRADDVERIVRNVLEGMGPGFP